MHHPATTTTTTTTLQIRSIALILVSLIGSTIIIQILLSYHHPPLNHHEIRSQFHLRSHFQTTKPPGITTTPKKKRPNQGQQQQQQPEPSMIEFAKKGLGTTSKEIDPELQNKLPSWEEVHRLYGKNPKVYGMETCNEFRSNVKLEDRLIAPAGTFNTGTNLLSSLLHRNCHIPSPPNIQRNDPPNTREPGIRFQVPWGKHSPPSYRNHNIAKQAGANVNQTNVLPILTIKDPITWMDSMCHHPYEATFRFEEHHCPQLVNGTNMVEVSVRYAKHVSRYRSLLHFWNEYYTEWMEISTFPKLVVRYEDLMFHAPSVITSICDCAGGVMKSPFRYREDSAKGEVGRHKGGAGFVEALVKYGNETWREDVLRRAGDRLFYRRNVEGRLMGVFGYAPLWEDRD